MKIYALSLKISVHHGSVYLTIGADIMPILRRDRASQESMGCRAWGDVMQFPHEKLSVYQKALDFFGGIQKQLSSWSKQHALVDHLRRAAESILFNLVEAVRLHPAEKKALTLDYAIGSVLECAACLDIAALKGLLEAPVPLFSVANCLANASETNSVVNFVENYFE